MKMAWLAFTSALAAVLIMAAGPRSDEPGGQETKAVRELVDAFGIPDQILAAIFVFAVLGKICDGALVAAFRPLLRWQDSFAQSVSRSAAAPIASPPVPAH